MKRKVTSKHNDSPLQYLLFNSAFVIGLYAYLSLSFRPDLVQSWLMVLLVLLNLAVIGKVANGKDPLSLFEILRSLIVSTIFLEIGYNWIFAVIIGFLLFIINYQLFTTWSTSRELKKIGYEL